MSAQLSSNNHTATRTSILRLLTCFRHYHDCLECFRPTSTLDRTGPDNVIAFDHNHLRLSKKVRQGPQGTAYMNRNARWTRKTSWTVPCMTSFCRSRGMGKQSWAVRVALQTSSLVVQRAVVGKHEEKENKKPKIKCLAEKMTSGIFQRMVNDEARTR